MVNGLDKHLPSFWVPSETPDANKAPMQKPVIIIILQFRLHQLILSMKYYGLYNYY
jgi:hypothetical protein